MESFIINEYTKKGGEIMNTLFKSSYEIECINCKTSFEVEASEVRAKEVRGGGSFIIICPKCGTHLVVNALALTNIIKQNL